MTKRLAIIIGSPLSKKSSSHLRGVKYDVQNIYNYLLSAVGGAWNKDEIRYFENPRRTQLESLKFHLIDADLVLVYYSGHGYMSNGKNYININDDETFPVDSLFTNAKRQITIVDACRVDHRWNYFDGISGIDLTFDNTDRLLSRQLFDFYINNAPLGNIRIFSSDIYQASIEDSQNGGAYTVSLMHALAEWYKSGKSYFLSIGEAFHHSREKLHTFEKIQFPKCYYLKKPDELSIPFAVNPQVYKSIGAASYYNNLTARHNQGYSLRNIIAISGIAIVIASLFSLKE